jgi:hypothetical protein
MDFSKIWPNGWNLCAKGLSKWSHILPRVHTPSGDYAASGAFIFFAEQVSVIVKAFKALILTFDYPTGSLPGLVHTLASYISSKR